MKLLRQLLVMYAFVGILGCVASAVAADSPKSDEAVAVPEMVTPNTGIQEVAPAPAAPKVESQEAAPVPAAPKVETQEAVPAMSPPAEIKEVPKDLVLKGDAKCTACHDEADAPGLLAIGKTRHGTVADTRTPSCTSCHGASDAHLLNAQDTKVRPKPDHVFSGKRTDSSGERNDACQSCHQKDAKRSHWEGSSHQTSDVACSSCHKVHTAKDMVRDKRSQPEVCFTCHKEQRAQVNKPSHHPIIEGKMTCSDCHNAHGSAGPKLMKRDSVVDTCYTCHMEKRGPFVHNHQPVNEDCSNCHNPHGTVAESMLKMRAPFLCNSCHTPHAPIQPSLAGQTTPPGTQGWWNPAAITQGRSCMNCHTQVHGSNNPSSANPSSRNLFR